MANAPTPGVGRRIAVSEDLAEAEEDWRRIVCQADGKDVTLRASSIGPTDEARFAQQTGGENIWAHWNNPAGTLSVVLLYWFAQVKNGRRDLQWRKVSKRFRTQQQVVEAGFEIYVPDEDPDDDQDLEPDEDDAAEEGQAADPT